MERRGPRLFIHAGSSNTQHGPCCSIRPQTGPIVALEDNQDVVIQNLTAPAETPWLLRLDGAQTRNIRFPLVNPKDLRRIEFGPGIDRSQLVTR